MMMRRLVFLSLAVALSGCGEAEHDDIKQWMIEASKDIRGHIKALPELKPFPVIAYEASGQPDPFSTSRLEPERGQGEGNHAPDMNRPREQLEGFPLESIHFIGVLKKNKSGTRHALIQVEGVVYQVGVGNYLGMNFGRIVDIGDTEIKLKEIVQDPSGQTDDWIDRPVSLQLLEGGAQGKGSDK